MSNPNPVNPTLTYKNELERLRREVFEPVKRSHDRYFPNAESEATSFNLQRLHNCVALADRLGWDAHLTVDGKDLKVTYVKRPSRW